MVGEWLLSNRQGKAILEKAKNPNQLERLVRAIHKSIPIPNLAPEGNYDEGIDWVTFGDLWETLKNPPMQLRKNFILLYGEQDGEPLYLLNVTKGQYNFLSEFYGGQGSAMYSVLSRWQQGKGRVDMTKELLEQLMIELANVHNRGGLNTRQQKSLDALYDKAEKLLQ